MSAFDTLKRFFQPKDTTIALPSDPFTMIDRERAIEKLKLDERAVPASDTALQSGEGATVLTSPIADAEQDSRWGIGRPERMSPPFRTPSS